jgi:hypothetical protein
MIKVEFIERMVLDGLTVMSHCYPMFKKGDPLSVLWVTLSFILTFRFFVWVTMRAVDHLVRLIETVWLVVTLTLVVMAVLYWYVPTQCEEVGYGIHYSY